MSKAIQIELEISKNFHTQGEAILISPKLLRAKGCGQVDLCRYHRQSVEVQEVKSKYEMGHHQRRRLRLSCLLLESIFRCYVKLSCAVGHKDVLQKSLTRITL